MEIDHECLALFLSSQEARMRPDGKRKRATAMNCLRTSIRCFFSYLHRAGYTKINAARIVKRAACGTSPPRTLPVEDQHRLLITLGDAKGSEAERDHAFFHLLLQTGVRISAALGIDVEDLNLTAGEVTIRTKGDRTERAILGEEIREHLRRYVGDRTGGPLFTCRDEHPPV